MGRYGKRATLVLLLTIAGVLVACGGGDSRTAESSGPTGKITVFAAASLTEAFKEIATKFEATFQGTKVDFNFAGTPTLRTQLEQGARADVFASANREQMALLQASGVVEPSSRTFARNSLVIITPVENRASVESVEDLGRDGLKLVLALEAVPVGAYTHQALTAMSVEAGYGQGFGEAVMSHVVSLESNVKQVVAKVELGEADAGIVYGTDVTQELASKLTRIEIPDGFNVIAEYPAALVTDRRNDVVARLFIDFLLTEPAQAILARHGFSGVG